MDEVIIKDLRLRCIIGTKPSERKTKQEVVINLSLSCNCSKAGQSDRLQDAVNYKDLYDRIISMASASRFMLIERLAEEIAQICLSNAMVKSATVRVDKPAALPKAASAAVVLRRNRS